MNEEMIRKKIEEYNPDVVVSVHPTMNYIPCHSIRKISTKVKSELWDTFLHFFGCFCSSLKLSLHRGYSFLHSSYRVSMPEGSHLLNAHQAE